MIKQYLQAWMIERKAVDPDGDRICDDEGTKQGFGIERQLSFPVYDGPAHLQDGHGYEEQNSYTQEHLYTRRAIK